MYIHKIAIKNFRLLKEVELCLDKKTTVIVGRNNSGKTSLTELFRRLLSGNSPSFRLEDFSLSVYDKFWEAFRLKCEGKDESNIRAVLPFMEVELTINYDINASSLGALSDFIIDLDMDCTKALIVIRYQLREGQITALFKDIEFNSDDLGKGKGDFFRIIKDRISRYYTVRVSAVDPNDITNEKPMDLSKFQIFMRSGFINAQRGLDDVTDRDRNLLGKVLASLYDIAAKSESEDNKDIEVVRSLEENVQNIQFNIDGDFREQLESLYLPMFELFGYPGLTDPGLITETTLDVVRLLKDNTNMRYTGLNGITLPETYNGLGSRNLIFILLKILEFFKSYKAQQVSCGIHLVFIEEPEVHLHPQMQEVFISKLGEIADMFAEILNDGIRWPVQFIVTTHSSHLANRAPFEAMRYFLATRDSCAESVCFTRIKDLSVGLGGDSQKEDREFLHKYMTLTRCDLLFADKAVLVEGPTERLLLPKMIEKIDAEQPQQNQLSSQYISVVEVGGAYAQHFFKLLDFLELRTLIITDLDTVKAEKKTRKDGVETTTRVSCKVSEGDYTSNACIKTWFGNNDIAPDNLIHKAAEEKFYNARRIAYQIPESGNVECGRSFEDAFMLANPQLFGLGDCADKENEAWEEAQKVGKTDFALEYAIEKTDWIVPRYIAEGLRWLAAGIDTETQLVTDPTVEIPIQESTNG
jgi:putative ATP-dependent endonuclease of the OLD family